MSSGRRGLVQMPAPGRPNDGATASANSPTAPPPVNAVHVLQSLRGHHALPSERDNAMPVKRSEPGEGAAVPSIALLPVADYSSVFREYEQRTSLYSHTDVARTLWGQMNLSCSVSIIKQSLIAAFDSERVRMQAAREDCLHCPSPTDLTAIERNSFSHVAEALLHGLLLASNRICRVTVSLFGHALASSSSSTHNSGQPPLATMPAYDMQHSPHRVLLASIPPAALAVGGVPGVVQAHELLHWTCGQDLKVEAVLSVAPWGCCLAGAAAANTDAPDPPSTIPMQQWAQAREDALRDLARSDDELYAPQGHTATVTIPGCGGAAMGTLIICGDGSAPITLYDTILAQHAAVFVAPLFSATASAIINDMFALSSTLCCTSLLQRVTHSTSLHHALLAIRDAVKHIFRADSVFASFLSDDSGTASTLHCCDRSSPVDMEQEAAAAGLVCYARESQQPLLVVNPVLDPRYNSAVDISAEYLPAPSNGSGCSLLIVPCVGPHPTSGSTAVFGFIQIARVHASSIKPCAFSATELKCISTTAASVACLMRLMHDTHSATSHELLPSKSGRARVSPSASSSRETADADAPLSAALLHVLSDRRDLALQLFRSASTPRSDARLRRIAALALAHADAPAASNLNLPITAKPASSSGSSRTQLERHSRSWKSYVARAIMDYSDHHSGDNVYDEDVAQALSEASLDRDIGALHFLVSALRRKLDAAPRHPSASAAISKVGSKAAGAEEVPPAPPSRRQPMPMMRTKDDGAASHVQLQQRIYILESQLAMADAAVRDASQRTSSSKSRFDAMQDELQSLTAALAHQSREWATKCRDIQERASNQAHALQNIESVLSCSTFALKQLAGLSPRVLNNSQAHQAISLFDSEISSNVCATMQQLLPSSCTVLASALIIGPPLPATIKGRAHTGVGIASLAFQRRDDFIMLSPDLHTMYTADVDAHHVSMLQRAGENNPEHALLSIYVDPAASPANVSSSKCPTVGVLQVLLQLPSSGPSSSRIFPLDHSDQATNPMPVAITRSQLICIRSAAVSVVTHVIMCCLSPPDFDFDTSLQALSEEHTIQGNQQQQQNLSLIALAENVFESDFREADAPGKLHRAAVSDGSSGKVSALKKVVLEQQNARAGAAKDASSKQPNAQRLTGKADTDSHSSSTKVYSPAMSLRYELKRQQSPVSSPPHNVQSVSSSTPESHPEAPSHSGQKILRCIPMLEEDRGSLYTQDPKSIRLPNRRAQNNFLIPAPASEVD